MKEFKPKLEELKSQIEAGLKVVDLAEMKQKQGHLESKMIEPGFWDDAAQAAEISKEEAWLRDEIAEWEAVYEEVQALLEMVDVVSAEHDLSEVAEYETMIEKLEKRWSKLNISTFFGGKYDKNPAVLTVVCGTGGTDAADFADMLFRMYTRYAESREWKAEILEVTPADEAGIKQATIRIDGPYAFGYLKFEHGVHRLVRLSPFNSGNTRETSFAKVDVVPEVHFDDHIEIDEKDIRVDVFRSSGAGGQSVNTTDSAVRITHLPTGIIVTCQNERSQAQNKETAMKVMQGKLHVMMMEKQAQTIEDLRGGKEEVSWGNQIRSYVLHPYKMVKDHRTDYEETNPDKVFDGEIHGFIERELEALSMKPNT